LVPVGLELPAQEQVVLIPFLIQPHLPVVGLAVPQVLAQTVVQVVVVV
jgi:hypothetical protein